MNTKVSTKFKIFNIVLASILGFSLSLAMVTSHGLPYDSMIIFMITFFINITLFFLFYSKTSKIISLTTALAIIVIFLIYGLFSQKLSLYFTYFISFFRWLFNYYEGIAPENNLYENIYIYAIYIIISIFIFIFAIKFFKLLILLPVVSVIYVAQWQLGYFQSKTAFILSMFMIIIYYFKHIFLKYYKRKIDNKKVFIFSFSMIPLSALIISIVLLIPKTDSPIIWEWLDDIYRNINNYFKNGPNIENEFFSFSQTGFGSGGTLGGSVRLDDTLVLRVKSDERLYLRGAILDTYTGNSWIKSSNTSISNKHDTSFLNFSFNNSPDEIDTMEYNEASFDLNMMYDGINYLFAPIQVVNNNGTLMIIDNYLNENRDFDIVSSFYINHNDKTEIIYENIKTKTVFHPLKTKKYFFDSYDKKINIDNNSGISVESFFKKDSSYSVEHYSFNKEDLFSILKNTQLDFYKNILSYEINKLNFSFQLKFSCTFNYNHIYYLNSISQNIYNKYLQLPEEIPQRVKDLAAYITVDYDNLLDKVKAIEKYLSSNFPYTLDTNNLPENRDFVDCFLFEEKKGYCTYYASSMVVMLRSIGIPARYVEGYILPAKKDVDGYYHVTNENAHAWPEVYLDGYGWVTFEPTSAFNAVYYGNQNNYGTVDSAFLENPYYLDYLMGLEEYETFDLEDFNGFMSTTSIKTGFPDIIMIIIFILIILFASILVFNGIRNKYKLYKKISLEPREATLELYAYIISLFSLWNYPPENSETAMTYSKRVYNMVYDSKIDFKEITYIYLEARYSKKEIPLTAKSILTDYINILTENIKYSFGKPKYFLYKYILGRF